MKAHFYSLKFWLGSKSSQFFYVLLLLVLFSSSTFGQTKVQDFEFEPDVSYKIVLFDGSELIAKFIEKNEIMLTVSTSSIPRIELPFAQIKSIELVDESNFKADGSYWFPNTHSTRYFFSPSAINLKKGEAYYQNTYLLINSFNYGVTNQFSIGGGLEFISTFSGDPLYFLTPKMGFNISEKLNLGAGVLLVGVAGEGSLGITYGMATYGNNDDNLTLGMGWGFVEGDFSSKPTITLGGMKRLKRKFSLVTESWFIPLDDSYYGIFAYGMRIFSEKIAVDLGLLNNADISEGLFLGVPYVDLVIKL